MRNRYIRNGFSRFSDRYRPRDRHSPSPLSRIEVVSLKSWIAVLATRLYGCLQRHLAQRLCESLAGEARARANIILNTEGQPREKERTMITKRMFLALCVLTLLIPMVGCRHRCCNKASVSSAPCCPGVASAPPVLPPPGY
jgi:hypothetical protein